MERLSFPLNASSYSCLKLVQWFFSWAFFFLLLLHFCHCLMQRDMYTKVNFMMVFCLHSNGIGWEKIFPWWWRTTSNKRRIEGQFLPPIIISSDLIVFNFFRIEFHSLKNGNFLLVVWECWAESNVSRLVHSILLLLFRLLILLFYRILLHSSNEKYLWEISSPFFEVIFI